MSNVIPQQDAIEVFVNANGCISIRQGHDLVAVTPHNAETLIRAIRSAKHEALEEQKDQE